MPTIDSLLTVAQVARLVGVSPRTVRRMEVEGRAPAIVRVGGRVRFRASEVDGWIRAGCPDRATMEASQAGVEAGR